MAGAGSAGDDPALRILAQLPSIAGVLVTCSDVSNSLPAMVDDKPGLTERIENLGKKVEAGPGPNESFAAYARATNAEFMTLLLEVRQKAAVVQAGAWAELPATNPLEGAMRAALTAVDAARHLAHAAQRDALLSGVSMNSESFEETTELANMLLVADMLISHANWRRSSKSSPRVIGSPAQLKRVVSGIYGIRSDGDARMFALRSLHLAAQDDQKSWDDAAFVLCQILQKCGHAPYPHPDDEVSDTAAIHELIRVWAAARAGSNASKWAPTNHLLKRFGLAANSPNALATAWKDRDKTP